MKTYTYTVEGIKEPAQPAIIQTLIAQAKSEIDQFELTKRLNGAASDQLIKLFDEEIFPTFKDTFKGVPLKFSSNIYRLKSKNLLDEMSYSANLSGLKYMKVILSTIEEPHPETKYGACQGKYDLTYKFHTDSHRHKDFKTIADMLSDQEVQRAIVEYCKDTIK